MFQKKHEFVTCANQMPKGDKLELKIRFSKATTQSHYTFLVMKEVNNNVCGLKPFICEMALKELGRMLHDADATLIEIRRTVVVEERSKRSLMEHAQTRKSTNTEISKRGPPTFVLSGTPDAQYTKSTFPR